MGKFFRVSRAEISTQPHSHDSAMRIAGAEYSRDIYAIPCSNAKDAAARYASLRKKRMPMEMPDGSQLFIFFRNSFEIPLEKN